MKRVLPWVSLLGIILLVACNLPASTGQNQPGQVSTPTLSANQIQTQISVMLTLMPSATVQAQSEAVSPTPALPTVEFVTATVENLATEQPTQEPTQAPTNTPEAQQPTATAVPPTTAPTATQQPPVPAATLAPGDPRSRLGAPTSTDSMDNDTTWLWPSGSDNFTRATFANGSQTIETLGEMDGWRMANPQGREFTNTYIEATFRTGDCSGTARYGIILRVPAIHEPDQGYLYGVSCDGRYSLRRWNGEVEPNGEMWDLIHNSRFFFEESWVRSTAINAGSNQTNRLGIYATGNRLILYANGTKLTELTVQGTNYSSGYFGVFVGAGNNEKMRVNLDEMSYWENPQQ